MALQRLEFPAHMDRRPIPNEISEWIREVRRRIEVFQDRWDVPQIEQFVAADYELVYQSLDWIRQTQIVDGNRFLEWGCGFAAVTTLAASLGWEAFGIESEPTLLEHGRRTVDQWHQEQHPGRPIELVRGNFLPAGSESLADDPTLPSLGHPPESAYERLGLDLDDFAIVYSYPWPGEDDFHELVFDRHAARGAVLVHFRGPNDVRAWRKVGGG